MKKTWILIVALFVTSTTLFSQTKQPEKKAPAKKEAATKEQPKAATNTAPKTTEHVKKDGTPDKRFKENKKAPEVKTKKDGTPDKRFKENKKAAEKKG